MLVLALLLGSSSLDHVVQSLLTRIARPSVAKRLQPACSLSCNRLEQVQLQKEECKVAMHVRIQRDLT